jgi:hypothetical protein
MKQNQVIAIEKGIKTRALQEITEAHHSLQKSAILSGISRTYRPKDEEGEQLPPEATRVQIRTEEIIRDTSDVLTKLFDVVATKDWANCEAFESCTRHFSPWRGSPAGRGSVKTHPI